MGEKMSYSTIKGIEIFILAEDYAAKRGFWGQHGACYYINIKGENNVSFLFDTGADANPILHNAKQLKIDLSNIDFIMLSHKHYDHTGGTMEILDEVKKEVPIIAHPQIFEPCFALKPKITNIGFVNGMSKRTVEEKGGIWVISRDTMEIAPEVITTGEVKRVNYFEKEAVKGFYTIRDNRLVPDEMRDDISLVINTEKGPIIIVGCGHAGILNIIEHVKKITGAQYIRAIVGGLHLINASNERIDKTIQGLLNHKVEELYVGHCTGLKAESMLLRAFGEKFHKLYCGQIIKFRI